MPVAKHNKNHSCLIQQMPPDPETGETAGILICRKALPARLANDSSRLSLSSAIFEPQEEAEKAEHPLNRIMDIEQDSSEMLKITTTDIHLPGRVGEAVHRAFHGDLAMHYDEDNYFVHVDWHRES